MISIPIITLAQSASIDALNNQLSIIGVIHELSATSFPVNFTAMSLVIVFELDRNERKKKIIDKKIVLAISFNKKQILRQEFTVEFKGTPRNRTIIRLPFLPIQDEGDITFELFYKSISIGKTVVSAFQLTEKDNSPVTVHQEVKQVKYS